MQTSRCSLHCIGDHENGRLHAPGLWSRIPETLFLNPTVLAGLPSLVAEILNEQRSMMLGDEIEDPLRQSGLTAESEPVLHVVDDDSGAFFGRQMVMRVDAPKLVLHEVSGLDRLPDI